MVTTYDPVNNTLIRLPRFRAAVGRLNRRDDDDETHQTKADLLSVLQSASRDVENATRRIWIPKLVTVTYDAPSSSLLNLFQHGKAQELLLNQPQGGPFISAFGSTMSGSNYRYLYNHYGAVDALEYRRSGIPFQWDTDHRTDGTYRNAIVIRGIVAAALYVPDDVAQATEMWAVIRWMQKAHNYSSKGGGFIELDYSTPTDSLDIARLLQRHTRYEGMQIQRVGTD